jgi:hypothetical protein
MAGAKGDLQSVDQEPSGGRLSALCRRGRFGHATQLRTGIAIVNAAIEGKIKLAGTPCERWQNQAHLLRQTGHRIAIGSETLHDNGRVLAAKELGWTEVPVIAIEHLDAAQRRAFAIADN